MKQRLFQISMVFIAVALILFIARSIASFKPFEYALGPVTDGFRPADEGGTRGAASFLWGFRQLDAIALAFLMLGSVVCCSALVGDEEAGP